ncbi:hypothetical protein TWF730_000448 [Orbilia blumenaviensis]|uniref:Uncharacterized protein n=1 Tax=Orbilia blumenaviensis TaxID=1796055 RepID=A0AAV9VSR3_9PEZI
MDPTLSFSEIREQKLIPRTCDDVGPKWTTWRATGLMSREPGGSQYDTRFEGFIEHVSLGWCITYNLAENWDVGKSNRGWLVLRNCDSLKELTRDLDTKTMGSINDEEHKEFINIIRPPVEHMYQGKTLREDYAENIKLARRVFLAGSHPTLRIGDNINGDITTMDINTICGSYGPYAKVLKAAKKAGDEEFAWPNWSIMADYEPEDTCREEMDTLTKKMVTTCPGEWSFGCGFGNVNMYPVFERTGMQEA